MSSSVTLSSAVRQNLLSLQDTAALTATTQNRLSTGKKVSSALDNPVNFFTSQSLSNRSSDLGGLLDGISNGVQTIQAANQGITSIQKLIDSAKSLTSQALASKSAVSSTASVTGGSAYTAATSGTTTVNFTVDGVAKSATLAAGTGTSNATTAGDLATAVGALNTAAGVTAFTVDAGGTKIIAASTTNNIQLDSANATKLGFAAAVVGTTTEDTTRTSLAKQFNTILTQIDQLAKDASYNGTNLISSSAATNKLHVQFNSTDTSNLDVQGVDLTSTGLSLSSIDVSSATAKFQSDTDVNAVVTKLTAASDTLRAQSSTFGSNLSVVQNRQDFSKQLINVLDTGAANLTGADLNEEAANSQALSTRQSLGISALSLANTAQQGILQLLR